MSAKQIYVKITDKVKSMFRRSDSLSAFDWVLFCVLAGFCFISYVHGDILITGNRSWILYDGVLDFYDNVAEWTQNDGANYMPSTFFLFAIWNLPLKWIGVSGPASVNDFRMLFCVWYKLLPLLFYAGSCYLIYRIGKEIGLGNHKSKLAMFAFMTMPVCFFSQFIFAQCDIFTMFFMLWGMYYYFRNKEHDMWRFALLFGVSVTFKYFSILIFLVLLLLRKKRPRAIIAYGIAALLPIGIEFLAYYRSEGFQRGVLGFNALNYARSGDTQTTATSVNLLVVVCVFLVLWAWFVKTENRKNEVAWALYLSCGICFALFAFLSSWHPQWLLFMAPFWVLSAFINIHLEKFLWIDAASAVVLQLFTAAKFRFNVDVNMMSAMVWRSVFNFDSMQYSMADLLPDIGITLLNSVFVVILFVLFVFKHPRYTLEDYAQQSGTDHMHLIRLRLILVMGLFTVTAFIAAYMNTALQ